MFECLECGAVYKDTDRASGFRRGWRLGEGGPACGAPQEQQCSAAFEEFEGEEGENPENA